MPDAHEFETKRLGRPFTFKGVDDAEGKVTGHGAVFDDPHPTSAWALPEDWQDIFRPGAFKKTLSEHKKRGVMPQMFLQHDRWSLPCGGWLTAVEDEDGLALEGQILTESARPEIKDLYPLVKRGWVSGLSIGFRPMKAKLDEKAKTRELIEVELSEISIVTFPGNDSARITDVKSADPVALKRRIETALRDVGLSRKEAKAVLADGFRALAATDEDPEALRDAAARDDVVAGLKALATAIHP